MSQTLDYSYNEAKKELNIAFSYAPNTVYTFVNVPKIRFTEMELSESKGGYYHSSIKGKYDYEKTEIE